MNVRLLPKAAKYLSKLDFPIKGRISGALAKLSLEPPQGDIVAMSDKDGYRLRVGKYRILFDIEDSEVVIHGIGLRGQIYK